MGIKCIPGASLSRLTEVSRFVAEIANLAQHSNLPYVGSNAFLHKAGLHVSAIAKWGESYQHIDPQLVGNSPRVVVSELSGKSNIFYKARELGIPLPPQGKEARRILEQVKLLESLGFQYEDADASFELLLLRSQPGYRPPFNLVDYMVVVERHRRLPAAYDIGAQFLAEATIKVKVDNKLMHTASEGNGPVNALDRALRKALAGVLPGPGENRADRLQGAHPGRQHRHRLAGARLHRIQQRQNSVEDGGELHQHHRGELAGALRQHGIFPAQGG